MKTIDLDKINVHFVGGKWRVWLPHSCSPSEPNDGVTDQVEWGDFYFTRSENAFMFVAAVLHSMKVVKR